MIDLLQNQEIPLFRIKIPHGVNEESEFFFTKIPWGEYKHIRYLEKARILSPWDIKCKVFEKYLVETSILKSKDIENLPAGIVNTVADLILMLSDSGTIPQDDGTIDIPKFNSKLNLYRYIAQNSIEYKMYTIICLVFRAYTFEILERMPMDQILLLFGTAEAYCLENRIISSPLVVENKNAPTEPVVSSPVKIDNDLYKDIQRLVKETPKPSPPQIQPESDITVIKAKHEKVKSGDMTIRVPGIVIDKNVKELGGFTKEEFDTLPVFTEEEALALQIQMGLAPMGFEFIPNEPEPEPIEKKKKKKTSFSIKR